MDRIEDAKPDWMRRGWVPQPVGQGILNFGALVHLAPEGRHVVSITD